MNIDLIHGFVIHLFIIIKVNEIITAAFDSA